MCYNASMPKVSKKPKTLIECACGCNIKFPMYDTKSHKRKYFSREHFDNRGHRPTENPIIDCACGCDEQLHQYDTRFRQQRFIRGHQSRIQPNKQVTIPCEHCGQPIVRSQWHFKRVSHQFCNQQCAGYWATKHGSRKGENNGYYNTITVPCAGCGQPVSKAASLINRRNNRVYCSVCIPLIVHPGRKGFYVGYPAEFNQALRTQIRKRDKYSCQLCGQLQKEAGTLHVHHIDYNRFHNDPMNLISLCRICHGQTNFDLSKWTQKLQALMQQHLP